MMIWLVISTFGSISPSFLVDDELINLPSLIDLRHRHCWSTFVEYAWRGSFAVNIHPRKSVLQFSNRGKHSSDRGKYSCWISMTVQRDRRHQSRFVSSLAYSLVYCVLHYYQRPLRIHLYLFLAVWVMYYSCNRRQRSTICSLWKMLDQMQNTICEGMSRCSFGIYISK